MAKYRCERGYKMVGEALVTCEDNGQWSGAVPECVCKYCLTTSSNFSESNIEAYHRLGQRLFISSPYQIRSLVKRLIIGSLIVQPNPCTQLIRLRQLQRLLIVSSGSSMFMFRLKRRKRKTLFSSNTYKLFKILFSPNLRASIKLVTFSSIHYITCWWCRQDIGLFLVHWLILFGFFQELTSSTFNTELV